MLIITSPSNLPTPSIVIGVPKWTPFSVDKLFGYVDGTIPCPPSQLAAPNGFSLPNSAYELWVQQDQLIMSLLISAMSQKTISLIVGKHSFHQIWATLNTAFANHSFSTQMSLQDQLFNVKQNNQAILTYLQQAKSLYDTLAAIGKQPTHEVFIIYILRGLDEEYKDLKSMVYSRGSQIKCEELHNYLPTHAFVNPNISQKAPSLSRGLLPTPPSVQYVAYDYGSSSRGRGRSTRDRFYRTQCRSNDRRSNPPQWQSSSNQDISKARCFVCDSTMHLANSCPHRTPAPKLIMPTISSSPLESSNNLLHLFTPQTTSHEFQIQGRLIT
ncbi:hypothetical protein LIER_40406 [Lithospermum erythrorhizon]|uniref:UBN2_3 domain-containing protein n=1 Tax=Lithospermum erythrorhizon TaxID=34254 RepID=A0AAV3QU18_LITER